jgi:hypothetical protein
MHLASQFSSMCPSLRLVSDPACGAESERSSTRRDAVRDCSFQFLLDRRSSCGNACESSRGCLACHLPATRLAARFARCKLWLFTGSGPAHPPPVLRWPVILMSLNALVVGIRGRTGSLASQFESVFFSLSLSLCVSPRVTRRCPRFSAVLACLHACLHACLTNLAGRRCFVKQNGKHIICAAVLPHII